MRKSTIFVIIIDVLVAICFFLFYGPIESIRNYLITTALNTTTHQYLAYIFYSEEYIQGVLSQNYYVEIDEEVDLSQITIKPGDASTCIDEYDCQVLEREEGQAYKIIDIKAGNSSGFLIAVYDPSKVEMIRKAQLGTRYGERIIDMCPRYNASVCINGGGFYDDGIVTTGSPMGYVIDNKQIVWSEGDSSVVRGNIIGFTEDDKLLLMGNATAEEALAAGVEDAMEFGPFLIVNGKSMEIHGNPNGNAPRTAIAQRKDGIVLFLIIDGYEWNQVGATLKQTIEVLEKYHAYNAANLDGGTSTTLIVENKFYNKQRDDMMAQGGRYVVNGWGLVR